LLAHEVRVTVLARKVAAAEDLCSMADYGYAEAGRLDATTLSGALKKAALLVNATPAGMWPHADESPLPPGVGLPRGLLVYDLVYRPRRTRLLAQAEADGCRTLDGLGMLLHQGAAAFELWTGQPAPLQLMQERLDEARPRKAPAKATDGAGEARGADEPDEATSRADAMGGADSDDEDVDDRGATEGAPTEVSSLA
jgi:shikimate 5-dehydrogenase